MSRLKKIGKYCCVCLLVILCVGLQTQAQDDRFTPGQDFYVEAEVSNLSPYLGEQIIYTFRYYAFVSVAGTFVDLPDFGGFWLSEVYELVSPRVETINNQQYNVYERYAFISPTQTGELVIGSGAFDVPATVFREALLLESNPVTVQVRPLPEDAPESFNGAVGQFDFEAALLGDTLTTLQPITLTAVVSGTGNLEQLAAPSLNLPDGWRSYAETPEIQSGNVGGLRIGEKRYSWLLIPELAGTQPLTPLEFSYFDPLAESYITLSGGDFVVEVFPGEVDLPSVDVDDDALLVPLAIVFDEGGTWMPQGIWWLVLPAIVFGVGGGRVWLDYRQRQRIQRRRNGALKRALSRVKAIKIGQTVHTDVGKTVETVIICYLEDRDNRPVGEVQFDDLIVIAAAHCVEAHHLDVLRQLYAAAQAWRYVPQSRIRVDNVQMVLSDVCNVLTEVDVQWCDSSAD